MLDSTKTDDGKEIEWIIGDIESGHSEGSGKRRSSSKRPKKVVVGAMKLKTVLESASGDIAVSRVYTILYMGKGNVSLIRAFEEILDNFVSVLDIRSEVEGREKRQ